MNGFANNSGRLIAPRRRARLGHVLWLSLAVGLTPWASAAEPAATEPLAATASLPDLVDDILFGEALRARGLHAWLEQDWADHTPADDVEAQLRRREELLAAGGAAGYPSTSAPASNREAMRSACDILVQLIAKHPSHPGRLRWQYELARDYLERQDPSAFEHLLIYELPGRDHEIVRDLSGRAIEVLTAMRGGIAKAWQSVEAMDEGPIGVARDSGSLAMLELLDAQSAALLTWARLHQALTGELDARQRAAAFAQVLNDLNESGRLDLPPGREYEQASALLIAGLAERHLGLYEQADNRARHNIALLGRIRDRSARQRLRQTALISVLEQIRAGRDAGRYDSALQAIELAKEWARTSRSDNPATLVSVSLLEATVLYGKQQDEKSADRTANQPAVAGGDAPSQPKADEAATQGIDWLECEPSLAAVEATWRQSSAHRDLLYEVLAPALTSTPLPQNVHPFALVLLAGSGVIDAHRNSTAPTRLDPILPAIQRTLGSPRSNHDPRISGELKYLLGEGLALIGDRLEAVQVLTELAEQISGHDRADSAIRQAVTWAGRELRQAGPSGSPASRHAFIRAARVFRDRLPDDPNIPELTYAVGAALESEGRFEEAAREFAKVPAAHNRAAQAALGRIRCWRQALEQETATQPANSTDLSRLAGEAKAAVLAIRDEFPNLEPGHATSSPSSSMKDCDQAKLLLTLAELLNHPALDAAEQAVTMLEGFEQRFEHCTGLLGPVLRQRIVGLRQLKRLTEARTVLEQYLAADPDRAGTAMAGLLQSMHEEVLASRQRHDDAAAVTVAAEAVQVGQSLLAWAAERPGRLRETDRLVIRLWYASALLESGRSDDALAAFERLEQDSQTALAESGTLTEIRLGRADALLDSSRADEALVIYTPILQSSPEHSDPWWHALVGSLRCHAQLTADPADVLQSIRQQRFLAPDLGGGQWKRQLTRLEQELLTRIASPSAD